MTALSTFLYRRPALYGALLLIPPLLWFGTVYLGSLFTLLAQSIYSIDEFTAKVVYEPTLATYQQVVTQDRKSRRLNSSHPYRARMPSSA